MPPNLSYIITRAIAVIVLLVALLYGFRQFGKHTRKTAVVNELAKICGESTYYRQFSANDARKTLVRAIGLLAEAESLGMTADDAIKGGLGVKTGWFDTEPGADDLPLRQMIIQSSLRSNYDNFIKLGFKPEFQIFNTMQDGDLAEIPDGPYAGKKPVVRTLIPEEASPGMEKVIANLELAPPMDGKQPLTDLQIAAAKNLARELYQAQLIEEPVMERIVAHLTPKEQPEKK